MAVLLLWGCAAGKTVTASAPAAPVTLETHIYPLPLDNVLAQTTTLLQKKGWTVKRAGNVLLTNWQGGGGDTLITYRIFGQLIDSGLCAMRVERLVATTSTSFNTDRPPLEPAGGGPLPFSQNNPNFLADPLNDGAAGTAAPAGAFSPADLSRPSPWVVSQHRRDTTLERELEREIDPTSVAAGEPGLPPATEGATDSGHLASATGPEKAPIGERQLADLAGIWDGTFTFRGTVVGSFSGEVTVAVDGRSVLVDDFCPQSGGALAATGANNSAAWEGSLSCTAIPVKGCTAAALTYSFAHAVVNDSTLTVLAAGTVDTPPGCSYSSGALSVAFVAHRADYIHLAVTRVKRATSCSWPSDWEDFNSAGSMAMPVAPQEEGAYLGIIRTNGSRLGDIERLLRECHQVVMFRGEPVLMKLAVTRPHHQG